MTMEIINITDKKDININDAFDLIAKLSKQDDVEIREKLKTIKDKKGNIIFDDVKIDKYVKLYKENTKYGEIIILNNF